MEVARRSNTAIGRRMVTASSRMQRSLGSRGGEESVNRVYATEVGPERENPFGRVASTSL
jgi:hypothetical protein